MGTMDSIRARRDDVSGDFLPPSGPSWTRVRQPANYPPLVTSARAHRGAASRHHYRAPSRGKDNDRPLSPLYAYRTLTAVTIATILPRSLKNRTPETIRRLTGPM